MRLPKKGGCVLLIPICFENQREKDKTLFTIRMLVNRIGPDAITSFTETWVSSKADIEPSHDPDRKEAIMVMVETALGVWHGFQYFTRRKMEISFLVSCFLQRRAELKDCSSSWTMKKASSV